MPEVEKRNSCQFFVMRCYFFRTSHFDGLRPASSGQVVNYRCSLPRTQLLCRSILASRCYCQIPPIIQSYVLLSLGARGGKVENGFPRRKYLSPDQARGGHAKGCFFFKISKRPFDQESIYSIILFMSSQVPLFKSLSKGGRRYLRVVFLLFQNFVSCTEIRTFLAP